MIKVYFATNREFSMRRGKPKFGNGFHQDSPHNLRFGWAEVEAESDGNYVVRAVHVAEDPTLPDFKKSKVASDAVVGSKGMFEDMRVEMEQGSCDVVCLIHGFANDFDTALARAAEITDKYAAPEHPLIGFVFSWPANGRLLPFIDYYSDRHDAMASGFSIARAFQLLMAFLVSLDQNKYCRQSLHLVAHSMGNWALAQALDDILVVYNNHPPRIFDQVFLMAADADNDALEEGKGLARLPDICNAINVYFSKDDRALIVSDLTKFNPDRLGATGPRRRDHRKVTLVDCQHVDTPSEPTSEDAETRWDLSVHQYYRLRREVIDDVGQVLRGAAACDVTGRRYMDDDRSYQIIPLDRRFGSI